MNGGEKATYAFQCYLVPWPVVRLVSPFLIVVLRSDDVWEPNLMQMVAVYGFFPFGI